MATEFRLGDDDRKKYGENTPEWVVFDPNALSTMPIDESHPLEQEIREAHPEMNLSLVKLLAGEFGDYTGLGIKSVVWLAWKMAGVETPRFKDFNIQTLQVSHHTLDDDADPPADGSLETSSEQTPS